MGINGTLFEFPLNERIRAFLRLEAMFNELDHFVVAESNWEIQSGIYTLNRLLNFLERKDYKLEIIQELEKQACNLNKLIDNPDVDDNSLEAAIRDTDGYAEIFRNLSKSYDDSIRKDELLATVRLRSATANLTSSVDLPCLHSWLNIRSEQKQERLSYWVEHFAQLKSVVKFILSSIRKTSLFEEKIASLGTYQQSLNPSMNHSLIRITTENSSPIYPEISGGRHRINVRFLEMTSNNERARQVDRDISFHISLCT